MAAKKQPAPFNFCIRPCQFPKKERKERDNCGGTWPVVKNGFFVRSGREGLGWNYRSAAWAAVKTYGKWGCVREELN